MNKAAQDDFSGPTAAGLAATEAVGQSPSKGRIVMFYSPGIDAIPAMILEVHSAITVNLRLFTDGLPHAGEYKSSIPHRSAVQDDGDCWDWPERV